MKSIRIIIILFALINLSILSAQNSENQGKTNETREVKPFTGIKVSSGIDVYLSMGSVQAIIVEAPQHILPNINTTTNNGILSINFSGDNNRFNRKQKEKIKVYVTATWIESIEVSSGSNVYCQHQLKLEKLQVKSSSGADAYIDVECIDLMLYSSSGSDIKIKGSTINLTAKASSGSDIKARELESVNAILEASAGSDIEVKVVGDLEARASSGADIVYYGNPIPKLIKQSSGGNVKRKN